MKHVIKTEDEWLNIRKSYITASDSAILLGLNPYSSAASLRAKKEGGDGFTGNANTIMGQLLEHIVVLATNEVLDTNFNRVENAEGHKEFYTLGKLGATPDAYDSNNVLLECKTTRPDLLVKYSGCPPIQYLTQLQTQMACMDATVGYLSIMGTNLTQKAQKTIWPVTIYKVTRMDKVCKMLEEEADRFLSSTSYRVNSTYKKSAQILLSLCYQRVHCCI